MREETALAIAACLLREASHARVRSRFHRDVVLTEVFDEVLGRGATDRGPGLVIWRLCMLAREAVKKLMQDGGWVNLETDEWYDTWCCLAANLLERGWRPVRFPDGTP